MQVLLKTSMQIVNIGFHVRATMENGNILKVNLSTVT